jgi:hypothetical protein
MENSGSVERKYRLPRALSFSFEDFLAHCGHGLFEALGLEPEQAKGPLPDNTVPLLWHAERLAEPLFRMFAQTDPILRTQQNTPGAPWELGPTEQITICLRCGSARYEIRLDRAFNGHLGCWEDDFSASFEAGERKAGLRCYLFSDDELTLRASGLEAGEVAELERLLVRELGLTAI